MNLDYERTEDRATVLHARSTDEPTKVMKMGLVTCASCDLHEDWVGDRDLSS